MDLFRWAKKKESIAIVMYARKLYHCIEMEQPECCTLNEETDSKTAYRKGQIQMKNRIMAILEALICNEVEKYEFHKISDESEIFWRSIKKFGYPPDDVQEVLVTMRTFSGDTQVFEAVWNGRCWTDTYEGYYNFEKNDDGEKYAEITHWAYMPQPPKEKLI